jgi:O-antigen/teichoic acid export membrane protein
MPWLVPTLFGDAYAAADPAVMALLPGVCVLAASRLLARYFQAVDSQLILLVARGAGVAMLAALSFSWIPVWGITGAACASLGAGLSEMALITLAFVRVTGIGLGEIFVPRRSDLDPYRMRANRLLRRLRAAAEVR